MSLRKSLLCASFCASTMLTAIAPAAQAAAPTPVGATAPVGLAWTAVKADDTKTQTPIKHLVVIFDENVSFDHYFATYPTATNPSGEPSFTGGAGTPLVDNLTNAKLLTNNPNDTAAGNGANAANPFRLDRTQAATADQSHSYTPEQEAYDNGKADLFPEFTGSGTTGGVGAFGTKGQVMGYFDGNTVTALWNYAQHFSLNDNTFTDTYGPSTPGALEVVSGQTNGAVPGGTNPAPSIVTNTDGSKTLIGDGDPTGDTCSSTTSNIAMTAKNIGDLLNETQITWGGFMGGFDLATTNANGTTGCARSTPSTVVGETTADYVPHHNWFQYFASTANPTHARPVSVVDIGYTFDHNGAVDPANHEYDLNDFYNAVNAGNYPSVSYIKLPAYQDGHAGYSDPLDEQAGLVKLINFIQSQPDWKNTAIIVTYDDSDGWYDHHFADVSHSSSDPVADQLNGHGLCGTGTHPGGLSGQPVNGRCGPGTRIPFLLISPWSHQNFVEHGLLTQASVVSFIEDNWFPYKRLGGGSFDRANNAKPIMDMLNLTGTGNAPKLILDPTTGEPVK